MTSEWALVDQSGHGGIPSFVAADDYESVWTEDGECWCPAVFRKVQDDVRKKFWSPSELNKTFTLRQSFQNKRSLNDKTISPGFIKTEISGKGFKSNRQLTMAFLDTKLNHLQQRVDLWAGFDPK